MKIGIIGTGAIGGTIAKKMSQAGHEVKIANSGDPQKLKARANELGTVPSDINNIAKDVDVLILSVPTTVVPELSGDLFSGNDDLVIVDTTNYYPFRDGEIEELKNGKVESVWVSEKIGRPVIKAFNNLLAETLINGGKEQGEENRIAMAISGDDEQSKKSISSLANDAGYDVVDAGSLSESWRHQPGTPAYCTELDVKDLSNALLDADKNKAAEIRDFVIAKFMNGNGPATHQGLIELNRSQFAKNPKTTS
ncbi:MAG: NAD(P)-binding domain-containing protein [Candidatus Chryseobacterium colombiense]|nr:NAD(P)-binding domain-containing protein [Chryseobacterium sp.]WEK71433.1 MAG: NAD(P)-binding domain-containing protein [Chryseobacterium sp.]